MIQKTFHHVAIVSYFSIGAYDTDTVDEDLILSEVLTELGISHEIVVWSDPDVKWNSFSCLLIKSVWDYFDYYPEFLDWIERMKLLNIPVWNALDTILWNSSKEYLLEIEKKGFPVISGIILEAESKPELGLIRQKINSDTVVVKPLVSGGAKNTLKIKLSDWNNYAQKLEDLLQEEDFLVQPYIPEVAEVGEYSLLFFNGKFSHAVLKTPAKSDFRVQHYFGGTIQVINPKPKMLESCQKLMDTFAPNTLYGRVDGVEINGVFHLMELELIEPYLFLALSEKAIPNYKAALKQRLLGL
ncbi:ATP-grasp domain-containing protein [Algoriphagus boritolerans]|uniref:Glutathione synthetase, ATP-grasp domain n=1 Tax=Algoriphagus boritolerans DSM 17298 = JCM 18970 TaxID=1120964 RepID=A0A1H5Y7B7_9BACT|nr:glutathione synthetase [Algoriphagus boritolerans]SEG19893.1 glutathione synthetase, ATP-grasp domain [Algoriphagus boritolerans DSM 17298 = JCM 18970]